MVGAIANSLTKKENTLLSKSTDTGATMWQRWSCENEPPWVQA